MLVIVGGGMRIQKPTLWQGRRGLVLGLVSLGILLNYADRQIIAVLKPMLQHDLGWTDGDYGRMTSAFQFATAFSFLGAGWLVDRIGWRRANPLGVALWSLAAIGHAVARTVGQFTVARAALGVTEALNSPTAIKTAAALYPNDLRAMAYGIISAASTLGAIVTPLVIPVVALKIGWANAFLVTGGLGFLWVVAWLGSRASQVITAEPDRPTPLAVETSRLTDVLGDRRTWAVAGARACSDSVWWLLLYWMPDLFNRVFHLGMSAFGVPLAIIYAASGVGALLAGFVSTRLLAVGVSINATRKSLMLTAALLVIPVWYAASAGNYWLAVAILGLTLAAHQCFSINIFALATDISPPGRVGTVIAIQAFSGNIAGMAMLSIAGWTFDHGYGYAPLLAWASAAYLLGVGWVQLMLPHIEGFTPGPEAATAVA
ncbi:MAG TPA: MFS transporter [Caulobacteraceae bacterium]|jgi:ACS family hexuronate transporter-like MFS transporter